MRARAAVEAYGIKCYGITRRGVAALGDARRKIAELVGELLEADAPKSRVGGARRGIAKAPRLSGITPNGVTMTVGQVPHERDETRQR